MRAMPPLGLIRPLTRAIRDGGRVETPVFGRMRLSLRWRRIRAERAGPAPVAVPVTPTVPIAVTVSPTIRIDMARGERPAPAAVAGGTHLFRTASTHVWPTTMVTQRAEAKIFHLATRIARETVSHTATLRRERVDHHGAMHRDRTTLRWRTNVTRVAASFAPVAGARSAARGGTRRMGERRSVMIHHVPERNAEVLPAPIPAEQSPKRMAASLVMRAGSAASKAVPVGGGAVLRARRLSYVSVAQVHRVTHSAETVRRSEAAQRAMPSQVWRSGAAATAAAMPGGFAPMMSAPTPVPSPPIVWAAAPVAQARPAAPVMPDTDRLVNEVMRRIDKQIRNERFRRGLGS